MFALVQHQTANYDDQLFDVTIGVYTTKEAADVAANDMNAAYFVAFGEINKHSVVSIPINTIIAEHALPWSSYRQNYEITKHFEHIKPGYCGSPPVETDGLFVEYQGNVEIIPGPKADELQAKLSQKLQTSVSIHDKRKIRQLVGYNNDECLMAAGQFTFGSRPCHPFQMFLSAYLAASGKVGLLLRC